MDFNPLTLRHCLRIHSLGDFVPGGDLNSVITLAQIFCSYGTAAELMNEILSQGIEQQGLFIRDLMIRYNVCIQLPKSEVFKSIYYLNGRNFNGFDAYLDLPITHFIQMIEILSEDTAPRF